MEIAEGEVVAGRYVLEKPLARGGMGAVWVARHLQLDSHVAIKFMGPTFAASSAARLRFEREAKAAAQIHSPHIVHVYDYGIEGDTPFLVMELLDGEDLGVRLKRVGVLSLDATADILLQVSRALRIAHAKAIVHRDLKPGNIFLSKNDDVIVAKVLDFGIAKTAIVMSVDESTKTDQILGSPQYMSPEQTRRSRDVDPRSDLWAVGVIAYRAISGKLPFTGQDLGDVLVKICTEPAPPPSFHKLDLPPTLDRFFERALAKSPEHRFQTASDLAAAFTLAAGLKLPAELVEARKAMLRTIPIRSSDAGVKLPAPPPLPAEPAPPSLPESDATTRPTVAASDAPPTLDPTTVPRPAGSEPSRFSPEAARRASMASNADAPTHWTASGTPGPLSVSSLDVRGPAAASPAGTSAEPRGRGFRMWGIVAAGGLALSIGAGLASQLIGGSSRAAPAPAASLAEGSSRPPSAGSAAALVIPSASVAGPVPSASELAVPASPIVALVGSTAPRMQNAPATRPLVAPASGRLPSGVSKPPKGDPYKPKDPLQDM